MTNVSSHNFKSNKLIQSIECLKPSQQIYSVEASDVIVANWCVYVRALSVYSSNLDASRLSVQEVKYLFVIICNRSPRHIPIYGPFKSRPDLRAQGLWGIRNYGLD
jgi:hypothetical protein